MLKEKIQQIFAEQDVDVLYTSSDEIVHYSMPSAATHVATLQDKNIKTWFKNGEAEVRELGKNNKLGAMVQVVDLLKQFRLKGLVNPTYQTYLEFADKYGIDEVVNQSSFEFMANNVYGNRVERLKTETHDILTQGEQIVPAEFMGHYNANLLLYRVGDHFIMTCPTRVELMTVKLSEVFHKLFPKPVHSVLQS